MYDLSYFKRPVNTLLFLQVFFSLLVIQFLLYFLTAQRLLEHLSPSKTIAYDRFRIEFLKKSANFFLTKLFRSKNPCLLRSLFLFRHLKMMGMDIQVAFGVKDDLTGLKGHAWLVLKGKYYLEKHDPKEEYKTIFIHP